MLCAYMERPWCPDRAWERVTSLEPRPEFFVVFDAALKLGYSLLKFIQIADAKGYPVAEAWLQISNGTDDEGAKHIELAMKMAEKEEDRKVKKSRAEDGYSGYSRGGGRGGGRVSRQGHAFGSHAGTWPGFGDAYMQLFGQPLGYSPSHVPASPFFPPPGPGPAQVVKALGAPPPAPGAQGRQCYNCKGYGHYASVCPMPKVGPPM